MLQEPEGKIYHGEARRNTAKHGQTFRGYRFEAGKDRRLESEKGERRKMEDGRKEDKQDQNGERSKSLSQGLR